MALGVACALAHPPASAQPEPDPRPVVVLGLRPVDDAGGSEIRRLSEAQALRERAARVLQSETGRPIIGHEGLLEQLGGSYLVEFVDCRGKASCVRALAEKLTAPAATVVYGDFRVDRGVYRFDLSAIEMDGSDQGERQIKFSLEAGELEDDALWGRYLNTLLSAEPETAEPETAEPDAPSVPAEDALPHGRPRVLVIRFDGRRARSVQRAVARRLFERAYVLTLAAPEGISTIADDDRTQEAYRGIASKYGVGVLVSGQVSRKGRSWFLSLTAREGATGKISDTLSLALGSRPRLSGDRADKVRAFVTREIARAAPVSGGEPDVHPDGSGDAQETPEDVGGGEADAAETVAQSGSEDQSFDLGDIDTEVEEASSSSGRVALVTGFVRSSWAGWVEQNRRLAKARESLDASFRRRIGPLRLVLTGHGEYDAAYLSHRDSYDQPTLDEYEWRVDTRDAYVGVSKGAFDVAAGRQIVAWGAADLLSSLDVVSPRDTRDGAEVDIDDARLPVLATRATLASGAHRLEVIGVHEARFDLRSPPFGPFSPLPALNPTLAPAAYRYEDVQDTFAIDTQQVYGRYEHLGDRFDLGVYGAWLLDSRGIVLPPPDASLVFPVDHRRYSLGGLSAAVPWRKLVIATEVSALFGRSIRAIDESGAPEIAKLNGATGTIAVTYASDDGLVVVAEVARGYRWSKEEPVILDVTLTTFEAPAAAIRIQDRFLHEDLRFEARGAVFGLEAQRGWFGRLGVQYRVVEDLWVEAGYITYRPRDQRGPISGLTEHDRVLGSIRWDFSL